MRRSGCGRRKGAREQVRRGAAQVPIDPLSTKGLKLGGAGGARGGAAIDSESDSAEVR